MKCYQQSAALNPQYAEAYYNQGIALHGLGCFEQALAAYNQAIACDSEYASAYWNKALLLLLLGDFEQGWALYEWRWRGPQKDSFDTLSSHHGVATSL